MYKHLLKGKESRLVFIQLKQVLYTSHPTSGREEYANRKKKQTNADSSDSSLLHLQKEFELQRDE